jgi:hypothetical protein
MRLYFRWNAFLMFGLLAVTAGTMAAGAQASVALSEPAAPLLPQGFGEWKIAKAPPTAAPAAYSLANANKDALEECGPERSQVADYIRNGRSLHVEAIQFGDRTGAVSAYTLLKRPDMRQSTELGVFDATGDDAVLFTVDSTVVLVTPATDVVSLKPLAVLLPKVAGNKAKAPLLPTLVPEKGQVAGRVRYALGPASYQAEGGVLPAQSLQWEKSAEAVTAEFADKRGEETLTILLYPTPTIAGAIASSIQGEMAYLGPRLANARLRREGPMVLLASGTFAPDQAQQMVENIHLRQQLSFDRDIQPTTHQQIIQTYSLLTNIAILAGVLMLAAVLLGLFLGGGRAAVRLLRGKSAATEPEFLSLHLAPQNEAPRFGPPAP